jgi:hypothetical protein
MKLPENQWKSKKKNKEKVEKYVHQGRMITETKTKKLNKRNQREADGEEKQSERQVEGMHVNRYGTELKRKHLCMICMYAVGETV